MTRPFGLITPIPRPLVHWDARAELVSGAALTARFGANATLTGSPTVATEKITCSKTGPKWVGANGLDLRNFNKAFSLWARWVHTGSQLADNDHSVVAVGTGGGTVTSNLVVNGDFEFGSGVGHYVAIPGTGHGWEPVTGSGFVYNDGTSTYPAPHGGSWYASAGDDASSEMKQDIDVTGYASWIDTGTAVASFSAWVQTFLQTPQDTVQVIVEFRDSGGVLASYDSTALSTSNVWTQITDSRTVPVGTETIRIRVVGTRNNGTSNDAYIDDVSLTLALAAGEGAQIGVFTRNEETQSAQYASDKVCSLVGGTTPAEASQIEGPAAVNATDYIGVQVFLGTTHHFRLYTVTSARATLAFAGSATLAFTPRYDSTAELATRHRAGSRYLGGDLKALGFKAWPLNPTQCDELARRLAL